MARNLPKFTVGIEEEYQIIDPVSRELSSYIQEILEEGGYVLKDQIKPEFMQSQVEVGSRICHDMKEARQELARLRSTICELADRKNLMVAAASTHPFSQWSDQQITVADRYAKHEEALKHVARRLLIFGMHVHIGIDDKELMMDVMNQARYFLPHLLSLSTSSPFWQGVDTGLKSYRSIVFENMPRTGIPPVFGSWAEYQNFIKTIVRTGCIEEPTQIWWDIRPHPVFPTLEFRQSDICTTIDEAICIASLILAIVAKLIKLRLNNMSWRSYRHHLVEENKWRAVRWGLDGDLVDFGKQESVPVRDLLDELLDFVDDVLDELDVREEVEFVRTIMDGGTSADRQLAVYRETGSLQAVVDQLVAETRRGL
ncbi:MAG: carboxylate-amine ligase [Acidobacteria bacterium]|nr:carboxylate-amine ligase [Acidobacteriota bacterium]